MNRNFFSFLLLIVSFEIITSDHGAGGVSWKQGRGVGGSRIKKSPIPDTDTGLFEGINKSAEQLVTPKNANGSGTITGYLDLPPGYNKFVIPLANVSESIFIMVHLSIREVLDVDSKNEIIELDTELGVYWIDWEIWKYILGDKERLKKIRDNLGNKEEVTLDAEFLKHIWKPDIYIDEMAAVERTSILAKLITLRFLVNAETLAGAITFKARQTLKLRCDMDFRYYPADIQRCKYNIRSYSYAEDELFLMWFADQSVYLDAVDDSNYDFQISDVEPGEEYQEYWTTTQPKCCKAQNFSTLAFTLEIRRNLTYHMVQTYLPSILLIMITWLCFLLPPDMVEVRIGISMTTVLTLTAMFTAVREQAPEVSYTMAIDVWMVFCIFLVFIALVLFTVIYWMRRRLTKLQDKGKQNVHRDDVSNDSDDDETYKKCVNSSKKYAFLLFAVFFIVFLTTYIIWLIVYSEYYTWNPSPKFNAVEDQDEANRLFVTRTKPFKENVTKKVVAADRRFLKLFKRIIEPKLKELDEEDYEAETEDTISGSQ